MPRPLPLPDELLEEVLRRLPPDEPAELVRAALVSRRWCRVVSDPGFRRRFRVFHRSPPMLGMLCNFYDNRVATARFVPTTAFCTPRTDFRDMRVLDARHGRVLFQKGVRFLMVWDPITDRAREIPFPEKKSSFCTAAVLCSAAASACDHLDCHNGPFLVACLCLKRYGEAVIYTFSSNAGAWSEPDGPHAFLGDPVSSSVLVGNALYFGIDLIESTCLKYNFDLRQMSMIELPSSPSMLSLMSCLLTTTEDVGLGFITEDDSKLFMWSRKDTHEVDAKWERRIIELNAVFPVDVDVTKLLVIGSGADIIFMRTGNEVYTIDLKTYKVKKVYDGKAHNVFPYMSFYTAALEAACSGEEPSAGGSSA